ncbi:hypothetical protein FD754_011137 [Muntiacus muntjak]|uniref:Uncharacterized protein n=1 Tax=Muntiacus muntjak TaxID=9888 RepID=A0A5N3VAS3_MUNMU|nr:hypothetical protein FD754_011137 [Muntiacus muntjak]
MPEAQAWKQMSCSLHAGALGAHCSILCWFSSVGTALHTEYVFMPQQITAMLHCLKTVP